MHRAVLKPLASTLLILLCAFAPSLGAQESIFDPENPGWEEWESDESADQDDAQTIIDPENVGSERDVLPLTEGRDQTRTLWTLDYEVAGLLHPGLGPKGKDPFELLSSLGAELRHELSPTLNLVLAGRFNYWAGAGEGFRQWRTDYEPRLELAYLNYRPGRWSFTIGQRQESWGSTDLIRPGDVIDPVDMRQMRGGGFGAPLSQLSAAAAYSAPRWSVRAVLVPFFQPNRITLFGRDTALISPRNPLVAEQLPFLLLIEELLDPSIQQHIQPFLQATERPQELPLNTSAGLRGAWTLAGADLGLGAFYGWDRTPWVELDEDISRLLTILASDEQSREGLDSRDLIEQALETFRISQRLREKIHDGQPLFISKYRRRLTILADFARYIGPIGVRVDVAFSPKQVFYTTEFSPRRRASIFAALGLSYEHLSDDMRPLAVILEGFWLHPFSWNGAINRAFNPSSARTGEEALLLFDDGYYGLAAALSWHLPWMGIELQTGGMATIAPGDLIGQIMISRRFLSGLALKVGANLFWGPAPKERLTLGGLLAQNNRIYLAVDGHF